MTLSMIWKMTVTTTIVTAIMSTATVIMSTATVTMITSTVAVNTTIVTAVTTTKRTNKKGGPFGPSFFIALADIMP